MLLLYFILYFTKSCLSSEEIRLNDLNSKVASIELSQYIPSPKQEAQNATESVEEDEGNITVSWDTYIALLIKVTQEQIENVKKNTIMHYELKPANIKQVNEGFINSGQEYEQMLQHNLKKLVEKKEFNATLDFMVDFLDLSNYLLEQIIEQGLSSVGGKLLLPTKWYKQIMKQKVLRQQTKIATNFIESHMCWTLSVCKDRIVYTQYLTEWLRHLLNLSAYNLKNMFLVIPDLLEKHMHVIKSNTKFIKTVKYIVRANEVVQRDTLDYLDEVLNAQKNVLNIVPKALKKGAGVLMDLFQLIDSNYDLNDENEDQLESISKMIRDWKNGGNVDMKMVLEKMLTNMQINLKIWPLDVQNKIDVVWSSIILL